MNRINRLKGNIISIYVYYFFRSLIFAYVIERLFWRERGISVPETVYLEFIYAAVLIVLEVPSGVWADRFSRATLVKLSGAINLISAVLMLFAHDFMFFALIIVLAGIYGALSSGSANALIYDSLIELDMTHKFKSILARIKALRYASGIVAAMVGSFLATQYALITPYQVSVVSCIISFVAACFLLEPKVVHQETGNQEKVNFKLVIQTALTTLKSQPMIRRVLVTGAVIGSAIIYFEEFWQNYFELVGVNTLYFGLISAAMSISVVLVAGFIEALSGYIERKKIKPQRVYMTILLVMTTCFFATGLIASPWMLIAMVIATLIQAFADITVYNDLHTAISSTARATMESVYAMIERVFSIIVGLVFAYFSGKYTVMAGFIGIGGLLLVSSLGLLSRKST